MNKKIYVSQLESHTSGIFRWYDKEAEQVFSIEQADIVMFPGGTDVHPTYYGEKLGPHTYCNKDTDVKQVDDFRKAIELNKFIIGICRGAQLACVMSGGKLIQHIENHVGDKEFGHLVVDVETKVEYWTNSLHHQMMFPYHMPKADYTLIAYCRKKANAKYFGENYYPYKWHDIILNNYRDFAEPEAIYFPKSNAFGMQWHPEMMTPNHISTKYIVSKINHYYENHKNNKQKLITTT